LAIDRADGIIFFDPAAFDEVLTVVRSRYVLYTVLFNQCISHLADVVGAARLPPGSPTQHLSTTIVTLPINQYLSIRQDAKKDRMHLQESADSHPSEVPKL
jgi:hypothetical protein